jgi:hypothetical protein
VTDHDLVTLQPDPHQGDLRAAISIERDQVRRAAGFDELPDFWRNLHDEPPIKPRSAMTITDPAEAAGYISARTEDAQRRTR